MRAKPNKKIITALVGLAAAGTVSVGAYQYYNVDINIFIVHKL